MTAKFPTVIADSTAVADAESRLLRPDSSTRPETGGDFFGFISQAMNRNPASAKAHLSDNAGRRADETDSTDRARKTRPKNSADKKEDGTNCTDAPVAAATAASAAATAPAPVAAGEDGAQSPPANVPTDAGQEAAGGSRAPIAGVGTELPNATEEGAPKVPSAQAVAAATQAVEHQLSTKDSAKSSPGEIRDGISAAPHRQQMKSTPEKDENAGRTLQKLPRTPAVEKPADGTDGKADGQSAGQDSRSKLEVPVAIHVISPAEKSNAVAAAASSNTSAGTQSAQSAQIQVERISRLVNQEVVMIQQSGASSLAVSLKVDSRTELFLQLTNHDGQLQASLRLERGDFAGLDRHWGQLQESLARQNIQLLPLEQKAGANSHQSSSEHSAHGNSDRSPDQPREHGRGAKEQASASESEFRTTRTRGKKPKKTGRPGWESWA